MTISYRVIYMTIPFPFTSCPFSAYGNRVPFVVVDLIDQFYRKNSLNVEGVFRINSSGTVVGNLLTELDRGRVQNYDIYDSHAITGALKAYLRQHTTTDPLVQFDAYESFVRAVDGNDSQAIRNNMAIAVKKLDRGRFLTLRAIILLLKNVTENSAVNKMVVSNISICVAPCLMKNPTGSAETAVGDNRLQNNIVGVLIENVQEIFGDVPEHPPWCWTAKEIGVIIRSHANQRLLSQLQQRWQCALTSVLPYAPGGTQVYPVDRT